LPTTFTEEAGGLAKRGVEGAGQILKYGLYAALVIGGVVVLSSLASTRKKGR
jgi:hypothetical protein